LHIIEILINLQNVKAPDIIPFATAGGKRTCAKRVKGACKMVNRTGGITSLNLENVRRHQGIAESHRILTGP
jgi:hypothetical protein